MMIYSITDRIIPAITDQFEFKYTYEHFIILLIGCALQLLRLEVPHVADPRWEKIALTCEYDLNGIDLYSVKWYKDGAEFFRYMPGSDPASRAFAVEGVKVDVSRSDSKTVVLLGQWTGKTGKNNGLH